MDASRYRSLLTPCTGICTLDAEGLCEGCQRSGTEIASWSSISDEERLRLMTVVLPLREARRR